MIMQSFAGLTEENDLTEGLFASMKKRLPWLILLLFLGMGVSSELAYLKM